MKDQSRGRGHRERKNTGDGKKKADKLGTSGMRNDAVMDFLFASSVPDL